MEVQGKHVSVSLGWDLCRGMINSKWCRALLVSGLFLAEVMAGSFLITGAAPAGWMIAAALVSGYMVGLLLQLPFHKTAEQMKLELGMPIKILSNRYKYSHIVKHKRGGNLYLGPIPNRIGKQGEHLSSMNGKWAVLSLNERREKVPSGLLLPYTAKYWEELDVEYEEIDAEDHVSLTIEQLDHAADWIEGRLEEGKNVYVHCFAGRARSAMAIAGYLIKYQKQEVCSKKEDLDLAEQAKNFISGKRPITMLDKKLPRLRDYIRHLGYLK